jgi:hypothetical protein
MSGFRSLFSKIGQAIIPQSQVSTSPSEQLDSLWQGICNCTLANTASSLSEIQSYLKDIMEIIIKSLKTGTIAPVSAVLSQHQIPRQLLLFAIADVPHGLINEVIKFFSFFTNPPCSSLLPEPYIIAPLNSLIENSQSADPALFFGFIESLLRLIPHNPDGIQLFLVSETSSPLIHQFSQLIVTRSSDLGDVLLQLLISSKSIPGLLQFILTYSPLVSTLVDLTRDSIVRKNSHPKVIAFTEYLNMSITHGPSEFSAAFSTAFNDSVVNPLVVESNRAQSLMNSIYILSAHTALPVVRPIVDFVLKNIQTDLTSEDSQLVFLAVRLVTLLFEKFEGKLPQAPSSVHISLDFMGLIRSEWFVRSEINQPLQHARALVSMSSSGIPTEGLDFDLAPILPILLDKFATFLSNPLRLNLALTEFFAIVATKWSNEATFFSFSGECENGLCKTLAAVCLTVERRIGQRPGTTQQIELAYGVLSAKGEDSESELFIHLVVLLEFLKELHAIAQTKNLLRQRDSMIVE